MPIKDQSIYPPYWRQFSEYIRFERATNKCEECAISNGHFKYTLCGNVEEVVAPDDTVKMVELEAWYLDTAVRISKIVLTVAHLDHEGGPCDCKTRTGFKCANPAHVKALCQACHLRLDMPKHIEKRRETLAARNDARRGLFQEVSR